MADGQGQGSGKKRARRHAGHFRLAHELKIGLNELLGWKGPLTHRQFEAWRAWLQSEWNEPSRTDHYLMMLAQYLWAIPARVWGKNPDVPGLDRFEIPFSFEEKAVGKQTVGEMLSEKKVKDSQRWADGQRWSARLGGQIAVNRISPEEMARLDEMSPDEAARARMALAKKAG